MTEIENYTDIDINDVVDDTDQLMDTDNSFIECDVNTIQNSELNLTEAILQDKKQTPPTKTEVIRATRLPMSRIKNIMKTDPDVNIITGDATFIVTKATELFLEMIAKETHTFVASKKKKTITKKDLDIIIGNVDCLCFLEGAMDF